MLKIVIHLMIKIVDISLNFYIFELINSQIYISL
jgi:hypothetical protein